MSDQDPDSMTEARRDVAMREIALAVEKIYGPRCNISAGGCMACVAWAAFDMITTITDSEFYMPDKEG